MRYGSLSTFGINSRPWSTVGWTVTNIVADQSILYEGGGSNVTVTYTVTTSGIPDSTRLYYSTNTTAGTIGAATFTSASTTGNFTVTGNTGTITLTTATEDGNSTNDAFTLSIRKINQAGPVMLTGANVKIVDLTTYNTQLTNYTANGLVVSYTTGQAGAKGATPSAGGTSSITFAGTTITATGGTPGTATAGGGGGGSGGDGAATGGSGGAVSVYSGGGGALAGGNGGTGTSAGGTGGTMVNASSGGLYAFLAAIKTIGWGSGTGVIGTGGTPATSSSSLVSSFDGNVCGGGAGGNSINGQGGNGGGFGGGGGGSYNKLASLGARGDGGPGAFCLAYLDGTTTGNALFNNPYSPGGGNYTTSFTLKSDWTTFKVWAIGGGGGARSDQSGASAGGGAGGLAWKTFSRGSAPTKPPLA